jgi:hypothetical protein
MNKNLAGSGESQAKEECHMETRGTSACQAEQNRHLRGLFCAFVTINSQ